MKMSNELYKKIENEIDELSKKINITEFRQKMLKVGNSETRFAFDVFYMAQISSKLGFQIYKENLNDDHLLTALKKILKKY